MNGGLIRILMPVCVQEAEQRKEAERLVSGDQWEQLFALVSRLEQSFPSWPEAHVLAYESFERRGHLLCCLRALKRGIRSADTLNPLFLPLLIRFYYKGLFLLLVCSVLLVILSGYTYNAYSILSNFISQYLLLYHINTVFEFHYILEIKIKCN